MFMLAYIATLAVVLPTRLKMRLFRRGEKLLPDSRV